MALINSDVIPASATAYKIEQSLRFNRPDNAYLRRTPSSAGNQRTWTWSAWVKRGDISTSHMLFESRPPIADNDRTFIILHSNTSVNLEVTDISNGSHTWDLRTTQVFRDPSAWYHIVVQHDTTQATSSDRIKIYVNGERVTAFNTATYPSQNYQSDVNASLPHTIGDSATQYSANFDGYLTEVNFIDGQALDPTNFGETGTYGEWKPIEYTGTYGTNGFYLPFKQDYQVEGFSTTLYTGTGTTQYIGGVGFQPNLVWMKKRSTGTARSHRIVDSVRTAARYLASDNTNSEDNTSGSFVDFENDGFTVGTTSDAFNGSGSPYVAWCWDMGDFENSELLTNGDFSTGSTSGWTTELGTYNVVTYNGNYVLDPATNGDSYFTQEVSVTAGTDYIVRANIPNYSSGNVWLYVYDSDYTDYNTRGTYLGGGAQTNNNSYHIAVTPSGSTMTIMVSTNGTQDWYMDNISVRQANEDGSISSLVHSNPTYGQSIVSYTGTGSSGTVGHGLSQAPEMVIVRPRTAATHWRVWHTGLSGGNYFMQLNLTNAEANGEPIFSSAPTSSVINPGSDLYNSNDFIAYCFHSVTGYSKFGSYTGTGASGNSITTGFRPAFLMVKRTDSAQDWQIVDSTRNPINPVTKRLEPNNPDAEVNDTSYNNCDFTDTGFTWKADGGNTNASGGTYIYMAFADTREFAYWLDQSGNNNDWESNNLTESDISVDSPTNNFATWNALSSNSTDTLSEGNCYVRCTNSPSDGTDATFHIPSSGKWYYEIYFADSSEASASLGSKIGIVKEPWSALGNSGGGSANAYGYYYIGDGRKENSGTKSSYGSSFTEGDIIGVAVDTTSNDITFYKNGTSQGSAYTIANGSYTINVFNSDGGTSNYDFVINAGQDSSFAGNKTAQGNTDGNNIGDFYYTPPSGYLALCTANLPDPAVIPSENFYTKLYTGNGSTKNASGIGFQPDFVWIKCRSVTHDHMLMDAVRGATKNLYSNGTDSEGTIGLQSFDSDGFTTQSNVKLSDNGQTYVAWNWKANGSGVSNTNGSITSTVSANQDAGFSIVSYTGTGSSATVGHGLSSAPEMIIVKNRDDGTRAWAVYSESVGNTGALFLNDTSAVVTLSAYWNNTSPTSTTFALSNASLNNGSGDSHIAYCFHSVDGFSKVGSYTGNGSTDGPFVYTGFRPAFVMVKRTNSARNWQILDNKRDVDNPVTNHLHPNLNNAEANAGASGWYDSLSNGFKNRATYNEMNNSGDTYLYIAFAENPFKYTNAR